MAFSDSQRYPWTVEDAVIFLGLKLFNSDNFHLCLTAVETSIEKSQISKLWTLIFSSHLIRQRHGIGLKVLFRKHF